MLKNTTTKNILLIVQRDNFKRDAIFVRELTKEFTALGYEVRWHSPLAVKLRTVIDIEGKLNKLPAPIRILAKIYTVLTNPYLWEYCFPNSSLKNPSIEDRCRRLKKYISSFGKNVNLVVLSRSAGGRVASLIADEVGIKKLICIGYPFKHPDQAVEVERFAHLSKVKTPFFIIQGTDDIYGGTEITSIYDLAPNTSVKFVDASHDFKIAPEQWHTVLHDIKKFISTDVAGPVYA
jgi:hypothetical protein